VDLVVVALKQPELGARLAKDLTKRGRRVELLDKRLPRVEFLRWLARSRTALCLPHETEGFYLPAIEAMALGALVVCPDAIGNREFCEAGVNCLFPAFDEGAILAAAEEALALPGEKRDALVVAGRETAARHGLDAERRAFVELLREAPRLWGA
jgi:glycosyltransferase involved in cell wall biosynthesis